MQHYLHYYIRHCPGYQSFLEKQKMGKEFVFSWSFFFGYLILPLRLRMYAEYFLMFFIYSFLLSYISKYSGGTLEQKVQITLSILGFMHIIFSFCFYKIYQYKLDLEIWKLKYDLPLVEKKLRPLNFIACILLFVINFIIFIFLTSIIYKNI